MAPQAPHRVVSLHFGNLGESILTWLLVFLKENKNKSKIQVHIGFFLFKNLESPSCVCIIWICASLDAWRIGPPVPSKNFNLPLPLL